MTSKNQGLDVEGEEEEEYYTSTEPMSQIMNSVRDDIVASLMNAIN